MVMVKIKTHEINTRTIKDSFSRRAVQFKNNIFAALQEIGVDEDDIEVHLEAIAIKRLPASVSWYLDGRHMFFSYGGCTKFVENLYVVQTVIEREVLLLLNEEKTMEQFMDDFHEDHDVVVKREKARELLGLDDDERDLSIINKSYKDLAKEHHPDKETGDVERFKEINNAHKILKRELL
jgi:hypothetical protein